MQACKCACRLACKYACMHVCKYACMHVCMYACMHVCMSGYIKAFQNYDQIWPSYARYGNFGKCMQSYSKYNNFPSTLTEAVYYSVGAWVDRLPLITFIKLSLGRLMFRYLFISVSCTVLLLFLGLASDLSTTSLDLIAVIITLGWSH